MGVQAMVKGAIANMRKTNATNVQALEKWAKRALKIAKDLGGSDDTTRHVTALCVLICVTHRSEFKQAT